MIINLHKQSQPDLGFDSEAFRTGWNWMIYLMLQDLSLYQRERIVSLVLESHMGIYNSKNSDLAMLEHQQVYLSQQKGFSMRLSDPFPHAYMSLHYLQGNQARKRSIQRRFHPYNAWIVDIASKNQVIVFLLILILGFLTMLKAQTKAIKQDRPESHSNIHYFGPQMIKSTIEIKSTIYISPSLSLHKKENQDRSNIVPPIRQERYHEGGSLREKINMKLQKEGKSRRTASFISEISADTKNIISIQRQAKECLSSIRKMLTQQSPPCTSRIETEKIQTKRVNKTNRQTQRQQFQQRQLQMILRRKEKQQAAQVEKLQNQIRECTFKPRLTVFKKR